MYLYGDNCCLSCIYHNPNKILEVYINEEKKEKYHNILMLSGLRDISKYISKKKLLLMCKDDNRKFSDIIIKRQRYDYCRINDIATTDSLESLIVILDQLTDQNNLGNIIRTSLLLKVDGIILPERSSAQLTSTTSSTSSGAIEIIKIHLSKNLPRTLLELKKLGYWAYSLDMKGEKLNKKFYFDKKTVLIVGNEGNGVRQNILNKSDFKISLQQETIKGIDSYNAANSLAMAAYHYKLNSK